MQRTDRQTLHTSCTTTQIVLHGCCMDAMLWTELSQDQREAGQCFTVGGERRVKVFSGRICKHLQRVRFLRCGCFPARWCRFSLSLIDFCCCCLQESSDLYFLRLCRCYSSKYDLTWSKRELFKLWLSDPKSCTRKTSLYNSIMWLVYVWPECSSQSIAALFPRLAPVELNLQNMYMIQSSRCVIALQSHAWKAAVFTSSLWSSLKHPNKPPALTVISCCVTMKQCQGVKT